MLNSRLAHFTAASPIAGSRHPLSRSYRVNLPSSLTTAHSSTLVYSTHPPVSVYGTDCLHSNYEDFLASLIVRHSVRRISPYCRRSAQSADLPTLLIAYDLQRTFPIVRGRFTPGSLLSIRPMQTSIGILTDFPSPTPLGLGLGPG